MLLQGILPPARAGLRDGDHEPTTPLNSPEQETSHVPDEVLVLLSPGFGHERQSTDSLLSAEAAVDGDVVRRIPLSGGRRILRVKLKPGKSVENALAENWRRRDKRIASVEPNYRLYVLAAPNDPLLPDMWALNNTGLRGGTPGADINAFDAWTITTGSSSVIVGVIDTGIDPLHPDLADNLWVNPGEIPGNHIDDDGNGFVDDVHGYDFVHDDGDPSDENGHGTHVAGTIAGRGNNGRGITGVSWQARLMACRFLNASGSGTVADAIEAIDYAVANGARILCNSWGGGGYSQALEAAIVSARDHGVLFVAAAGNAATNNDLYPHYPASYDVSNVISVAATDSRDALAAFSCYGPRSVHLAAPGVGILSTIPPADYASYSGTSMATPHVVGVAALLLAADPSMSLQELKSRLVWTGDPVAGIENKTISGRRLNAWNALTAPDCLNVTWPQQGDTAVRCFAYNVQWVSIGGLATVDIFLLKGEDVFLQIADDVANNGSLTWNVPEGLPPASDYRIWIDDGTTAGVSGDFEIAEESRNYFTECFVRQLRSFDLANTSLVLTPDDAGDYTACLKHIAELPTDPGGGTRLLLGDDDSRAVSPAGGSVMLYGIPYAKLYVGSNGNITFEAADSDYSESLTEHFSAPRICGLWCDLDPTSNGRISWKQTADLFAVTWEDVPEYGRRNLNTFQIEIFFDGRIQLSWLGVGAYEGLVGLSEGSGLPVDFMETDVSEQPRCAAELAYLQIDGPTRIEEFSGAQFRCIAHYDDNSILDVTEHADIAWSVDSDCADVDSAGYVITRGVDMFHRLGITARLGGTAAICHATVMDPGIDNVLLNRVNILAGRASTTDQFACTATWQVDPDAVARADAIHLSLWAPDNHCVYRESLPFDPQDVNRGRYTYRARGDQDGLTILRFDLNTQALAFSIKYVDLAGLQCPVFILLEVADYVGLAEASEEVVNGRRYIPMQLMSGFDDALRLERYRVRQSLRPSDDSLQLTGSYALQHERADAQDVVISWNDQEFVIPGSRFTMRKQVAACRSVDVGNGIVSAALDPNRCLFRIQITKAGIPQQQGITRFGLAFDTFDEIQEIGR